MDDTFDPQNLEHWLLLLTSISLMIYGFWITYKMPEPNEKNSHRYNRETGKIERNEDRTSN
jgi:Ni,Fe-hydrogenase I cytochrome b subunit